MFALASPAFAGGKTGSSGKPGGGKTGGSVSFSLVLVSTTGTDGVPHWGDEITFNVSNQSSNPTVSVACYQNGTQVYSASAGFYPSYPWPSAQNMWLQSSAWTGGAASCTASLVSNAGNGSLAFNVEA